MVWFRWLVAKTRSVLKEVADSPNICKIVINKKNQPSNNKPSIKHTLEKGVFSPLGKDFSKEWKQLLQLRIHRFVFCFCFLFFCFFVFLFCFVVVVVVVVFFLFCFVLFCLVFSHLKRTFIKTLYWFLFHVNMLYQAWVKGFELKLRKSNKAY